MQDQQEQVVLPEASVLDGFLLLLFLSLKIRKKNKLQLTNQFYISSRSLYIDTYENVRGCVLSTQGLGMPHT
jgi:hypothetical protein